MRTVTFNVDMHAIRVSLDSIHSMEVRTPARITKPLSFPKELSANIIPKTNGSSTESVKLRSESPLKEVACPSSDKHEDDQPFVFIPGA
jgi:hypothetical protein